MQLVRLFSSVVTIVDEWLWVPVLDRWPTYLISTWRRWLTVLTLIDSIRDYLTGCLVVMCTESLVVTWMVSGVLLNVGGTEECCIDTCADWG